ncbi:MAG: F0F1 ATP synthase subunit gamma [Acidimicrobiia bacterium]|nr:F0F1 ATP synthase subunit gamma [Acidimicrobiia bacterium]MDH4307055.1 F0F1 ATP synthase subunit gamma [Acidimicrobiia bacterium]
MAGAGLRDTRRRIKSVEATKKITRAMELIAAARIPKAQARVVASKPYAEKLVEVIQNVGGAAGGVSHPLLEVRDVRTVGVLVVSADRGLAGAYASNVIRLAERSLVQHTRAGRDVELYVVGKKAQTYFRYRGYNVRRAFLGVTDTPGYGDARAVSNILMDAYVSGDIDAVEAYYTRYQSAMTQIPTQYQLLPLAPPEGGEARTVSYSYEPSPAEILSRILPRYVEATIFNMLLEASASEHSARRRAMKAATDNAEELIRILTVQANRARQAEITTAITEIVGGAEALAADK